MEDRVLHDQVNPYLAYPPWPDSFPISLAEFGRERLLRTCGLDLETYGTARMVRRRPDEPRNVRSTVGVPWGEARRRILIESLPLIVEREFESLGLRFANQFATDSPVVIETLEAAIGQYIVHMPGLAASIACLARVLHVLVAKHDDFDTSHSDPELPFSVFISFPTTRRDDGPLRVAEALVHETMHLQLSLLERIVPLIDPDSPSEQSYSPWRGTFRDAGGILHALYVFRVIERFWECIAAEKTDSVSFEFANARRAQIEQEIGEIVDFRHCSSLTEAGSALVGKLFEDV